MECKHKTRIKEKESCIWLLKSQLHDTESKFEQDKDTFEKEKYSLQMKLAEQEEMSKELAFKVFQNQVDKLQEEFDAYSVTCIQLKQQI